MSFPTPASFYSHPQRLLPKLPNYRPSSNGSRLPLSQSAKSSPPKHPYFPDDLFVVFANTYAILEIKFKLEMYKNYT